MSISLRAGHNLGYMILQILMVTGFLTLAWVVMGIWIDPLVSMNPEAQTDSLTTYYILSWLFKAAPVVIFGTLIYAGIIKANLEVI